MQRLQANNELKEPPYLKKSIETSRSSSKTMAKLASYKAAPESISEHIGGNDVSKQ